MSHDGKTEAPTPKRKRDARREGRVAKSPEIVTWGGVLIGSFLLPFVLSNGSTAIAELFTRATIAIRRPDEEAAAAMVAAGARTSVVVVLPVAIAMVAWAFASNLAQTRGAVATKRLKPQADRLNPIKGFKRLLSIEGVWQAGKVLLRTIILGLLAWRPVSELAHALVGSGRLPLEAVVRMTGDVTLRMIRIVAAAGVGLGLLDYFIAYRRTQKGLKMTKQEVRDEARNAEGDPLVKGQIRQRQRAMSRNRMLAAVADASVVIVNPTHVSVALRYRAGSGSPVVVAKGKGDLALRIREEAAGHGVPMVRDVPLARTLHDACEVGWTIPPALFEAVAKVLAYVMAVARRSALGGVLEVPGGRREPLPPGRTLRSPRRRTITGAPIGSPAGG